MPPLQESFHRNQPRVLNNDTKQASLFAVGIPFIAITSVVIALHVYVRVRLLKLQLAIEDCGSSFVIGPPKLANLTPS
jgi:hypothetical protein